MNNQDPICDPTLSDEEIKKLTSPANTSNFQDPTCDDGGGGGGGILNKDNLFSYVNALTSPFTNINDIKPFLCEVMRVAGLDPSIIDNIDPVLNEDPESSLQDYQDQLLNFDALKCTGDPRLSMGDFLEKMMNQYMPIAEAQVELIRSGQGVETPLTSEFLETKALEYIENIFNDKTKRFTDHVISISTPLLQEEREKAIRNAKSEIVTYSGWERYAVGHEIGETVPLCNNLDTFVYMFYVKIENFTEKYNIATNTVIERKSNHPTKERKYFRYYVDQKDLVAKNLNTKLVITKEKGFENTDHAVAMGTYSIPNY